MLLNNHRQLSQEEKVYQERIRQAKLAFNVYLAFVGTSVGITLFGVIFLLSGHISQAAYMALGSLTSTAVGGCCVQLSREANDRLDRMAQQLNDETKVE